MISAALFGGGACFVETPFEESKTTDTQDSGSEDIESGGESTGVAESNTSQESSQSASESDPEISPETDSETLVDSSSNTHDSGDTAETSSASSTTGSTSSTESTNSTDGSDDTESPDSSTGAADEEGSEDTSSDSDSACDPDTSRCVGVTQIQHCNAQGMWEPPQTCVDQACVNDQCAGVCAPNTTQCVDVSRVQSCSDEGQWSPPVFCVDQTCIGKQCSGECAQGQQRCDGLKVQHCDSAGMWATQETCDGPNETCEQGACVTTCEPWIRQFGTKDHDNGYGVAVDRSGNAYVTGRTNGGLDGNSSFGLSDIFVTKYSSKGVKQWTRQLGTKDSDEGRGVAVDDSGNVYVTGTTFEALDGNIFEGDSDIFVVKYSASGVKRWTRQFGSNRFDDGYGIAVDGPGNVYVTGATYGTLAGQSSAGNRDIVIAKYSSSGAKLWTRQLGTSADDWGVGIATDDSANVYITGTTAGVFSGNVANGPNDIFLAKYSSSGVSQWVRQFGTGQTDDGYSVAVDGSGNNYVAGAVNEAIDGNDAAGGEDIVIIKHNSSGTKQWTRQLGTAKTDIGYGIAVSSLAQVYIAGSTAGIFGGNGTGGNIVAKYNTSGEKQWTRQFGSIGIDKARGIAVDTMGHAFITGYTEGALEGNNSAGQQDAFIARVCKD